jgi:2-polyprenyl-3-methyl-5-hydroxy-6-metoxy-1,4-benzoquinol methylase
MDALQTCHNCGAAALSGFYRIDHVPVHSCLLMPNREAALTYPQRDLQLGFCRSCGFIENMLFDPKVHEYSTRYEVTQGFSPRFREFATALAKRLIEKYDLRKKVILEIGCGKGEFLALICELGDNQGIGLDPAYVPERQPGAAASRVTFVQDFYSEQYSHLPADVVMCRHTLEHIQPTASFMRMVRRAIGDRHDTIVFFEVPDMSRILKEQAFWDIYYEHCSYFSLGSLARLFRMTGFEVLELAKDYDDQYLLIDARPSNGSNGTILPQENDLDELAEDVRRFRLTFPDRVKAWKETLGRIKDRGQKAVIWGSGSKAVAYLTTMGIRDQVEYIVDVNPYKHGKYLAGTGHAIVSPSFLTSYKPDVVIAMNPIYRDEIQRDLDRMHVSAELIAV